MSVTTAVAGREDLLEEEKGGLPGKRGKCPEMEGRLLGEDMGILVDSGSEVSCISADMFDRLREAHPDMPVLPVTGLVAHGAFKGHKSARVQWQAYVSVVLNDTSVDVPCLVMKGLSREILFGSDWFYATGVVIDYYERKVTMRRLGDLSLPFRKRATGQEDCYESCHVRLEHEDGVEGSGVQDDEEAVGASGAGQAVGPSGVPVSALATREQLEAAVRATEGLDEEQQGALLKVLVKHREVFSDWPGRCRIMKADLKLLKKEPFLLTYPIALTKRDAVRRKIRSMTDMGIIERGSSPYVSPLLPVWKPNGDVRLTLDARRINEALERDMECPQRTDELLFRFEGDVAYMTTADCSEGFWQLEIPEEQRKYVAFMFEGRVYRFCRLPFGLHLSTAAFSRALDKALGGALTLTELEQAVGWLQNECPGREFGTGDQDPTSFLDSFVDDIRVRSRDFWSHLLHLYLVFSRLIDAGMTLKLGKTKFVRSEVSWLGHIISTKGVATDPEYVRAIREFPIPRNVRQLRAFLGTCGWYRVFVRRLALLQIPLNELLQRGMAWKWSEERQGALERIKDAFLETVMLKYPMRDRPFYVQTDASEYGLGCQLFQYDNEGDVRVLGFASRTLKGPELRYTVTEKEALGIVFALQKFRAWVLGAEVIVLTDHKALSFMTRCSALSNRLYRWLMFLQEFQLQIRYKSGSEMVVSDTLSRYPLREKGDAVYDPEEQEHGPCIARLRLMPVTKVRDVLKGIGQKQRDDPALGQIIRQHEGDGEGGGAVERVAERFREVDGVWFVRGEDARWRVAVPAMLTQTLTLQVHEELGHFGGTKTLRAISEDFWWRGMARQVRKWVGACEICQKAKVWTQASEGPMGHVLADRPGKLICSDLYGPLVTSSGGVKYLLVFVDAFTKHVWAYTLRRATTAAMIRRTRNEFLPSVRAVLGAGPEAILSDHGSQYCARAWRRFAAEEGFKAVHCSVRHPQSNPAERVMREIGRIIRTFCHAQHQSWALVVKQMTMWLNAVHHESTGCTPTELHTGQSPLRPWTRHLPGPPEAPAAQPREGVVERARERLLLRASRRKEKHDSQGRMVTYKVGDKVLLKADRESDAIAHEMKKFFLLYEGPYVITSLAGQNAYRLEREGVTRGVFNSSNLRPFKTLTPIAEPAQDPE